MTEKELNIVLKKEKDKGGLWITLRQKTCQYLSFKIFLVVLW